ncbi:Alpha/Beta hydrolase protein [Cladochytrium replicatum]|nr:Alpha/Beta hydrolase protein [Cladochytrium replicatum]
MRFCDGWVEACDGTELYMAQWEPDRKVLATVTAVHGLGDHIRRYDHVFSAWAASGIKVQGIDQRGHGRTSRGRLADWKQVPGHLGNGLEDTLKDLRDVTRRVRVPNVKHFIFGHSLGGLIALVYAFKFSEDVCGVVASSAALDVGITYPTRLALSAARWVIPTFISGSSLEGTNLCSSVEVRRAYEEDPYTHASLSIETAHAIAQWQVVLMSQGGLTFRTPVFLTHGSADIMTLPAGTKRFHGLLCVQDKTVQIFENLCHECHNEPGEKVMVIKAWGDWILKRSVL